MYSRSNVHYSLSVVMSGSGKEGSENVTRFIAPMELAGREECIHCYLLSS